MKKANRIILATKCSIIRDAQIAEKNEIAREFHNENLRLEKIMLVERDRALVEEELKREQERKNLLKYSQEIRKQLVERESIRAKEVERIEEEAIAMRKALDAMEKVRRETFASANDKLSLIARRRSKARRRFATRRYKRSARACRSRVSGANTSRTWSSRKVRAHQTVELDELTLLPPNRAYR